MLRRLLLTAIPVLLVLVLQAQPGGNNRTDAQGRKQGPWAKTWGNGALRYEGQFENDRPVGEFKHYNEEGELTTVQRYAEDGVTSHAEHLHPDGSLMARGKYHGQQKDSTWNYFDTEGRLRRVEHFVNGLPHGEVVTYYPAGQVAEKENYDHGVLHGPSRTWFANGNVRSEMEFVKGEPEGKMVTYHSNGKKEYEGSFNKGRRTGTWFHFNADGSVHVKQLYREGKLEKEVRENGTFTDLYGDEQVRSEVTYKNGKKEGPFVEYHQNGQWVITPVPADPVTGAQADTQRELKGQTKKKEGKYKNDLLEGEVKEYDEKGRLTKVTKYEAGVVVNEEVKR